MVMFVRAKSVFLYENLGSRFVWQIVWGNCSAGFLDNFTATNNDDDDDDGLLLSL
jgi:hypothetical protein